MTLQKSKLTDLGLNIVIGILFLIFCFSLFKNISYPLLWNDESEGVMTAQQILEYGYPKVHGDKNMVFMPPTSDVNIGYKKEYDANIYMTWGSYYCTCISVLLARFSDDLYTKTALIRIPFAVIGLAGLIIFSISLFPFFNNRRSYKWFLILFSFIELFSVFLVLHLREARYYSMIIFMCSCFFYVYVRRVFIKQFSYYKYALLLFLIFFVTFQINFIAFTIFTVVFFIHLPLWLYIQKGKTNYPSNYNSLFKLFARESAPVIAAVIAVIPFIIFFELLTTSKAVSDFYHFSFDIYKQNIKLILNYLTKFEFFYTFLFIKIVMLTVVAFVKYKTPIRKLQVNKKLIPLSFFLLLLFIVYSLIVSRTPYYLYVRFFIEIQPLMVLMMIIDLFIIADQIAAIDKKKNYTGVIILINALFVIVFIYNSLNKFEYIGEHIYEINNQYKGPLDYTIPYIKDNFKNTQNLVIATNYEEFSYMYYLGSRVIVGYIGNNLEHEAFLHPDIIVYRKPWGNFIDVFNNFLRGAKYTRVSFPIQDFSVNNIPEPDFAIEHQFRTRWANTENEKVDIFLKEGTQ
jgi:hypothetical protein